MRASSCVDSFSSGRRRASFCCRSAAAVSRCALRLSFDPAVPAAAASCGRRFAPRRQPGQVVLEVAVERHGAAVGDEHETVADRAQQRAVVRHEHQAAFVVGQRPRQGVAHFEVEVVGGLVEQQQVRPPAHEQRQRQPRLLAAGERLDRRVGHLAAEVEAAEVVAQVLLARPRVLPDQVAQRRLVATQLLDLVLREVADLQPVAFDAPARQQRLLAGERLDQRGLAGAVRTEQAESSARAQRQLHVAHDGAVAIAQCRVLERQQRIRRAQRLGEFEVERRVDVRGGDVLQPVERLEAALRLARLARLGAEALDEARHVRDLALLLLEHRLLHGETRGALRLERGVVAGVQREHAALEVRDVRDAAVEEVAVVRDQQQRAAVAREPALQPDHGVEVEVVGGFVEQQQVGAAHQRLREVQAHAPAAGEIGDRPFEVRRLEAQAREQGGGAGPRAVAVDRFEPDVQLGERAAIVRGVGGCDRPFDARSSSSPSSTNSIAACGKGGVSCATDATRQSRGISQSPASLWISPRSSANRLDLPLPLAPTTPTRQPGWICSEASSISRRTPRVRVSCRNWIKGGLSQEGRAFSHFGGRGRSAAQFTTSHLARPSAGSRSHRSDVPYPFSIGARRAGPFCRCRPCPDEPRRFDDRRFQPLEPRRQPRAGRRRRPVRRREPGHFDHRRRHLPHHAGRL